MNGISDVLDIVTMGASVDVLGVKTDENTKVSERSITVNRQPYKYYPWGADNRLPNKMMELVRSNGDVANLLETRCDFLFGSGIGLFTLDAAEKPKPFFLQEADNFWKVKNMDEVVDAAINQLVHLGLAYVNISADKNNNLSFSVKDGMVVRAVIATETESNVSKYVVSSKWDESYTAKSGLIVPAFDKREPTKYGESLMCLKKFQSGQFYYNYPQWWSLEAWIKLANRIANIYNNSLDTEGNIGMIMHVSEDYFRAIMATNPVDATGKEMTEAEVRKYFRSQVDKFLFGSGKNKILYDNCGVNANGELIKHIEFEAVKKSLTGKEYTELYQAAVQAISNASGVLGGLSGVSDGKMNSGGGTEIRQTALYQQFYRTPRERKLILNFLNEVFLAEMRKQVKNLPGNLMYNFKNIVLETLDKNPNGMQIVKSNAN